MLPFSGAPPFNLIRTPFWEIPLKYAVSVHWGQRNGSPTPGKCLGHHLRGGVPCGAPDTYPGVNAPFHLAQSTYPELVQTFACKILVDMLRS